MFPQYRNISLLAKQALTMQDISNGRLEFRTGAGATLQWVSQWWHPYGIDYPNNGERVSLLEEGIQLLLMLWTKSPTTFEGRHFKVKAATFLRKQTQTQSVDIPLTVAAKQDKTMTIAARYTHI